MKRLYNTLQLKARQDSEHVCETKKTKTGEKTHIKVTHSESHCVSVFVFYVGLRAQSWEKWM